MLIGGCRIRAAIMSDGSGREAAAIYLPPELISDILSRLSAKSFGRLRCVCHKWRALLSEQKFLKLHFSRGRNKSQNKFIIWKESQSFSPTLLTIDFYKDSSKVLAVGKILNSELSEKGLYRFCGSCNGLILLGRRRNEADVESIIIRNPITRESWVLPVVPGCLSGGSEHAFYDARYVLGYDWTLDDFKVVLFRKTEPHLLGNNTCSVYTLKSNCWKKVQNPPGVRSFYFGASVDDANRWNAYWISEPGERVNIFAFDFTDETFRVVEPPVGLKEVDDVYAMSVNGRCPCLINCLRQPMSEVWVTRENSWTKHLAPLSYSRPIGSSWFLWNDYELMVKAPTENHILYNLKSGISRELETQGEGLLRNLWYRDIQSFAESFLAEEQLKENIRSKYSCQTLTCDFYSRYIV